MNTNPMFVAPAVTADPTGSSYAARPVHPVVAQAAARLAVPPELTALRAARRAAADRLTTLTDRAAQLDTQIAEVTAERARLVAESDDAEGLREVAQMLTELRETHAPLADAAAHMRAECARLDAAGQEAERAFRVQALHAHYQAMLQVATAGRDAVADAVRAFALDVLPGLVTAREAALDTLHQARDPFTAAGAPPTGSPPNRYRDEWPERYATAEGALLAIAEGAAGYDPAAAARLAASREKARAAIATA